MKAIIVEPKKPGTARYMDMPEPDSREGSILVEAIAVGVCGTDVEIMEGKYGWAPPGLEHLILGHESLGRVIDPGSSSGFKKGDLVVGIVRRPDPVPCPNCAVGEWDMCRNGLYTERGIKEIHGYMSERWRIEPEYAIKLGGYPRELLIFFRDVVKYNLGAVEADWSSVDQYDVMDDLLTPEQPQLKKNKTYFTKLTRLDMYNTVWDRNTDPGSISRDGDYAGHIKILSRVKLRRLLNKLAADGDALNATEALKSYITSNSNYYRMHPQVSDYVASRKPESTINWEAFLGVTKGGDSSQLIGNYELLTLYARLCPEDLGIPSPAKDVPQVFKIQIVNGNIVICIKRIISAYDLLPILFGQPIEDGLGYQTKSTAEAAIPIQTAAKTLFSINFNSARRAVSDRALYNPTAINPKDVNSPVPAAKIPVNVNLLGNRPLSDHYYPIPFDGRGTESALRDGMQIVEFGKTLSGLNAPMQGQFQKGNKSVIEWRDTMGSADSRLRLQALSMEYQFFVPLKAILKFNIWQYGQDVAVISQKTGDVINVDIAKMRQSVMSFRVADGFIPKSKLAGTEAIVQVMQMISQSPVLQQQYGMMLPGIVAHLAQLMGVQGLNEYIPQQQQQQPQQQLPAPGPDFVDNVQKRDLTQQELALREQANQLRAQELASR